MNNLSLLRPGQYYPLRKKLCKFTQQVQKQIRIHDNILQIQGLSREDERLPFPLSLGWRRVLEVRGGGVNYR
jgi:hypothetical protein